VVPEIVIVAEVGIICSSRTFKAMISMKRRLLSLLWKVLVLCNLARLLLGGRDGGDEVAAGWTGMVPKTVTVAIVNIIWKEPTFEFVESMNGIAVVAFGGSVGFVYILVGEGDGGYEVAWGLERGRFRLGCSGLSARWGFLWGWGDSGYDGEPWDVSIWIWFCFWVLKYLGFH
jgi:hypothetical protein